MAEIEVGDIGNMLAEVANKGEINAIAFF